MDASENTIDHIDEFPRHKAANPYNYDALTLAKRQLEINAATKDFPHIPKHTIEIAWDTTHNIGTDKMNEIIKNKEWETKPKDRPKAGVYNTMTIEEPQVQEEARSYDRNVPESTKQI